MINVQKLTATLASTPWQLLCSLNRCQVKPPPPLSLDIPSPCALIGQEFQACLRCPGGAFLMATGAACCLCLPSLERLITNRCRFMCCRCCLSCLPSRQMRCRTPRFVTVGSLSLLRHVVDSRPDTLHRF